MCVVVACILALCFTNLFATQASASNVFEFIGEIDAQDPMSHLLAFYVNEFNPEELFLSVDSLPDSSGRIRDLYMNLVGVPIGGVRMDNLVVRMLGAQFNCPSEWAYGNVESIDALQIYAYALLREDDLNRHLADRTFGSDDHWSRISMNISPDGIHARGPYSARVLLITLNILIEINSGLRIVNNNTLWLDNYTVRINRVDVPDHVTRRAVAQVQPLLDLRRFPLPLRLHNVKLEYGQAVLSTRILPEPIQGGISYHFRAE
jgi:hypothetical protein